MLSFLLAVFFVFPVCSLLWRSTCIYFFFINEWAPSCAGSFKKIWNYMWAFGKHSCTKWVNMANNGSSSTIQPRLKNVKSMKWSRIGPTSHASTTYGTRTTWRAWSPRAFQYRRRIFLRRRSVIPKLASGGGLSTQLGMATGTNPSGITNSNLHPPG